MFHYSGDVLGAIRYKDFKVHIKAGHGGLPGMDFYNVMRDPGEKFGQLYLGLFAVTPIQITLREHMRLIQRFPHRVSEITPKGAELMPHDEAKRAGRAFALPASFNQSKDQGDRQVMIRNIRKRKGV